MNLTHQQERFAQALASGKSQADAYREAYPKSRNWAEKTLYKRASELSAHREVVGRVAELRKPAVDAVNLSLELHLRTLADLRDKAVSAEKFESAVKAEELRGRASGYYIERKEKGPPGAFEELTQEQREAEIRETLALAIKSGYGKALRVAK